MMQSRSLPNAIRAFTLAVFAIGPSAAISEPLFQKAHTTRLPEINIGLVDIALQAKSFNCGLMPVSNRTFLTNQWNIDCTRKYNGSSLHLINQFLRREAEKELGVSQQSVRDLDRQPFAFTG